eukprot:1460570-Prymnesium_polylepis.1
MWEIERAPPREYDPMLSASEQPAPHPDALVVTLHKAKPAGWVALFEGAVATRVLIKSAEEARREKQAERKADERKRNLKLGVTPAPGFGFTHRKFDPQRRHSRSGARQAGRAESEGEGASVPAADHWQSARAVLVWRDGCERLEGRPDGAADGEPLFSWVETAEQIILRAMTRRGLRSSDVALDLSRAAVEVRVGGTASLWSGRLTGRVVPAESGVKVLYESGAPHNTLQLSLRKAEQQ